MLDLESKEDTKAGDGAAKSVSHRAKDWVLGQWESLIKRLKQLDPFEQEIA